MVVYLDGILGMNFLVDWMILLGVNRMAGFPWEGRRTAVAAAVGSGYVGICCLPGLGFLAARGWRLMGLGVMSLMAFGVKRSAFPRGVLFLVLSLALGGMATTLTAGTGGEILGCGGALALLCRMGFRRKPGQRLVPVTVVWRGRQLDLTALVDTGNGLRDPLNGGPVTVLDGETARILTGLSQWELSHPAQAILAHPDLGLGLIPCSTVAQNGGLLLRLGCEVVKVNGQQAGDVVVLSSQDLGCGEYQALVGGVYG